MVYVKLKAQLEELVEIDTEIISKLDRENKCSELLSLTENDEITKNNTITLE